MYLPLDSLFLLAIFLSLAPNKCGAADDDSYSASSHIGLNYALHLQKNPLDTNVAASILASTFTSLQKAKLFGSSERDMEDAEALLSVGIKKITVAVPQYLVWNGETRTSAVDSAFAGTFVDTVIKPLMEKGATVSIAVGNEPFAYWHATPGDILLSAYRNVRTALIEADLKKSVQMMVPFQFGIIENSYPPSDATIRDEFLPAIEELVQLMYEDGDPFEINIYPYFAFRDNADEIPLEYALGSSGGDNYGSLFQAMHAAVEFALLKLHSNFTENNLIVVGEVGWPTEDTYFPSEDNGWRNDTGFPHANVQNAEIFLNNVLATGIPVYVFEAFDEQAKSVDSGAGAQFSNVENHWGIFTEDGDLKFEVPVLMESVDNTSTSEANAIGGYSSSSFVSGVCVLFIRLSFL